MVGWLVICGPSGSGKSTLIRRLVEEFPHEFELVVSHTTRPQRENESDGVDYHFVSHDAIRELIEQKGFIQTTEFDNHIYGTSYKSVNKVINQGIKPILDITIQGAQIIQSLPSVDARYVFIMVTLDKLERRLRARGGMDEEHLRNRLARAKPEIAYGTTPGNFNLVIRNENEDEACEELKRFVIDNFFNNQNNANGCCADPLCK